VNPILLYLLLLKATITSFSGLASLLWVVVAASVAGRRQTL
jgi:hypothetical protein